MSSPRELVRTPYRVGVLVLTLSTIAWRAWTISRWSWEDDDWLFIPRSQSMSLWSYAFQDHNGHLMPGGFLITKAVVEIAPLSFVPVIVLVTLASGLVVVVWGRTLELVTDGSILALVPLSLVALSPVMIRSMQWWAVSVNALPILMCLGLIVMFAARYAAAAPAGRRRQLGYICLVLVGGLFFWQKCLLVVLPATVTVLALAPGSWRERLKTVRAPFSAMAVISAAYLTIFLLATRGVSSNNSVEMTLSAKTPEQAVVDFARGFSHFYLPAMLGGPWGSMPRTNDTSAHQGAAVTMSVLLVLGLCVVWLAVRNRSLLWLLALPTVYVVGALSLVEFSTRARAGWDLMTTERYYTDAVAVGAVTMALMLGVHRRQAHAGTARSSSRLVPGLVGAFVLSLVVGNVLGAQRIGVHPGRDWTATLRGDLTQLDSPSDPTRPVVLWDAYAPQDVVRWDYWAAYASLSRMTLPLSADIHFNRSTDALYEVTSRGHVVPAEVTEALHSTPGPQEGCGFPVTREAPALIPLSGDLYSWPWVVRVTGFSDSSNDVVVSLGPEQVLLSMPAGLSSREIQYVGAVPSSVSVALDSGDSTLCVTDVTIGRVDPR